MFDDVLRAFKDRLLAPAAHAIGPVISPTAVSVLGFVVGVVAAGLAARQAYGAAIAAWLANRVLDGLDGTLARVQGRVSDFGAYLDLLLDFAVYALVPLGLVLGSPSNAGWRALAVLLAAFYVNAASWMYLAALLERRGEGAPARGQVTSIMMPPGLVAGAETIVFYVLFLLLPERAALLFVVMAALVLAGVVQRALWARRHL